MATVEDLERKLQKSRDSIPSEKKEVYGLLFQVLGKRIERIKNKSVDDKRTPCPICFNLVDANDNYCMYCGTYL